LTTDFSGMTDVATAVALQWDGKIVAAGYTYTGGTPDFALARYTSAGVLDTSFNGTGKLTTDFNGSADVANAVAVQPDGQIVAAGQAYTGGNPDFALARYTSAGVLDTSFNGTGKLTTDFF